MSVTFRGAHGSARRRDEQEAPRQKGYCLYSKLFNLFKLVGYFRRAVLVSPIISSALIKIFNAAFSSLSRISLQLGQE